MARKKQEIALQLEIETQEEYEEMLGKEGLTVVDVYQEWCGPCKAMISNFRRLKNELGDDLLHFSVAKADTVDALERYRGKCEPCFLFFAGGALVAVVRNPNSPMLLRTITEQLRTEHKVLDGQSERKEIRDPLLADLEDKDKGGDYDEDEEDEEGGMRHKGERIIFEDLPGFADDDSKGGEEVKKAVTVAIIKPNVVQEGKVDEVIERMKEAGIEILEHTERTLTEEEAREFYKHKEDEEYFEDLVKFMSSGPSHVLVLTKGDTGEGIIEEWRELLGPPSVEEARESAPNSLRAQYGKENYVNALHGSDSGDTAMRELAFFFPDFAMPTTTVPGKGKKPKIQRTLALIRPDALKEKKDEILAKIEEAGFKVALQKEVTLTREQAEDFYKEHRDESYFEELVTRMSCGPLLALGLAREDAVHGWRDVLGPTEVDKAKEEAPQSFRAQFSVDETPINQFHGSDSEETAKKELEYFFPMQQTVAAIKPEAYQTKDEIMQRIREAGFHIAARKETELSREMAEKFYGDVQDKEYFEDLVEHMTSGPTLFMVLSREEAVEGWRSLLGPTDPEKAKEENPESLRAIYGQDIKANAMHGSSDTEHAQKSLKLVFGDLEFNADGTVKGAPSAQRGGEEKETEENRDDEEGEGKEDSEETGKGEGREEGKGVIAEGLGEDAEAGDSEREGATSPGAESGKGEGLPSEGGEREDEGQQGEGVAGETNRDDDADNRSESRGEATKDADADKSAEGEEGEKKGSRPASAASQGEKKGSRPASAASQGEKKGSRPASAASQGNKERDGDGQRTSSAQSQKGEDAQSQKGEDAHSPKGEDAQSQKGEDTKSQKDEDTKSQKGEDTKSQKGEDTKSQKGEDTKSQKSEDTKSQKGEDTKSQKSEDTKSQKGEDTKSQKGEDTKSQKSEDTKSQKGEDNKSQKDEDAKSRKSDDGDKRAESAQSKDKEGEKKDDGEEQKQEGEDSKAEEKNEDGEKTNDEEKGDGKDGEQTQKTTDDKKDDDKQEDENAATKDDDNTSQKSATQAD